MNFKGVSGKPSWGLSSSEGEGFLYAGNPDKERLSTLTESYRYVPSCRAFGRNRRILLLRFSRYGSRHIRQFEYLR